MSGDVGAEVAAVLAEPCYVTRSETVRCSGFVDGTFNNGAIWTEDMCCYPCRVIAALAPLIAVRVEAAKAEVLREAADAWGRNSSVTGWLRDRAAALDPGPVRGDGIEPPTSRV